jgi:transposase
MLFVSPVNALEFKCLQEMVKNHPLPWTRIRANAVLLSDNKTPLQNIAKIYGVCRQTTATWLKNWEKSGIFGLVDKPGRGRHKILSTEKEEKAVEIATSSPRSLNQALAEIQKQWKGHWFRIIINVYG